MSRTDEGSGMGPATPSDGAATEVARVSRANPETKGALCVKCEHLNPGNLDACSVCGSHLYVKCHKCGAKNRRVNTRCEECQRRLHKGRARGSGTRAAREGFNFWVVGLVVGGILFTMFLLFLVSGLKLPRLW